jgi:hypothetical protein
MQRDELRFGTGATDSMVTSTLLSAVFPDERYDIDAFYAAANWWAGLFGHDTGLSSPYGRDRCCHLQLPWIRSYSTETHGDLQIQQFS